MLMFSRAEVQAALDFLCRGNGGGTLTKEQLMWELNIEHNGPGFGACLRLAAANPQIFPEVLTAPYMRRELIPIQNSITEDGRCYPMAASNSCDASGAPTGFYYGWKFPAATLAD